MLSLNNIQDEIYCRNCSCLIREAAKKVLLFFAGPLRGEGGGLNGCATKEKRTFFNVTKKVPLAT